MFVPQHAYDFIAVFARQANSLAMFYGGPVYFVGSALYKERPNDFDVRVVLAEEDIERRFGKAGDFDYNTYSERDWRWLYNQLKESRILSRAYGRCIDFQFQTEATFAYYQHRPNLRLDSTPPGFLEAGRPDVKPFCGTDL